MPSDKAEEKAREFFSNANYKERNEEALARLLRSHAEAAYREGQERMREKLKPYTSHVGMNCGGYHGDRPEECDADCGLLRSLPIEERKSDE